MAEQSLDVRVTEHGTAVVVSKLEQLTEELKSVEQAQQREAAAAERSAKANEGAAASVEALLKKTESKLAVFDRIAGLMGKVNLAIDLVTKAYDAGRAAVEKYILKHRELAPELEKVNRALAERIRLNSELTTAAGEVAGAAGLDPSQLTQRERLGSIQLRVQQQELEARQRALLDEELSVSARVGRQMGVAGGGSVVQSDELARVANDLEKVGMALAEVKLKRDALIAGARTRETGGVVPTGGGGAVEESISSGIAEQLPGLADSSTAVVGQIASIAETSTMAAAQVDTLAGSFANAASQGLAFAEATGKGALAAAAAALVEGESIQEALHNYLKVKATEAGVEALWATGKALVFTALGLPEAGPMFAAAGYFAATAAAAGVGAAVTSGGGGGGGSGAARSPERDIGPQRERQQATEGPTTINVSIDGLALSTADTISEGVVQAMERAGRTPGQRSRLRRLGVVGQ